MLYIHMNILEKNVRCSCSFVFTFYFRPSYYHWIISANAYNRSILSWRRGGSIWETWRWKINFFNSELSNNNCYPILFYYRAHCLQISVRLFQYRALYKNRLVVFQYRPHCLQKSARLFQYWPHCLHKSARLFFNIGPIVFQNWLVIFNIDHSVYKNLFTFF